MAHEISIRSNGMAEMAYVGEKPWHGLGQELTKGASIGVWKKEAGFDWEALEGMPQVRIEGGSIGDNGNPEDSFIEFPDHKCIYRSDTGAPLSIVGADYKLVQPNDVLEFCREFIEDGSGWYIHTAGILKGGRKLWVMASNDQVGTIGKKRKGQTDEVRNNLLFATSLDGSMRSTVADTSVRVVCQNTLNMALRSNDRVVTISHRSVFDGEAVKRALGLSGDTFEKFIKQANDLADTPCDVTEARDILNKVFNVEEKAKAKPDTSWLGALKDLGNQPVIPEDSRVVSSVLALFNGDGMGADMASAKGTRWGLLNAVTEHVDHHMGRTDDTRIDSAWFGRGAGYKAKALELLTA